MADVFTPTVSGFTTQVVEYPHRSPEQQIVYDANSADDFRHFTVEDAATGTVNTSDQAVTAARDYLGATTSDIDESEGGHAD
jgi:hypothetical protein